MPLHENFQPLVKRLLSRGFPGSNVSPLEILEEQSSLPVSPDSSYEENCDQFKLLIPFAGHTLVWEVRFNLAEPKQAPDFIFDDESFTLSLDVDIIYKAVPRLLNWDANDPDSLFDVVEQLVNLYTDYQLQILSDEWSHLKEEVDKLSCNFGMKKHQIQVLQGGSQLIPQFCPRATRPPKDTVSLALFGLEALTQFESIQEEFREIAMQFTLHEYDEASVAMHIHPVLYKLLEDKGDLNIPYYSRSQELYAYVKNVNEIILTTLNLITSEMDKREEFHNALLLEIELFSEEANNFTYKILEASPIEFTSCSFLLKFEWVGYILSVKTPFSSNKPQVFLRPITSGNPSEVVLDSLHAWDAHKLLEVVSEKAESLKAQTCQSINS